MKKIVLGKSEKNRKWQRKPVDLCHAIRLLDEILPQSAKIKLVKDRQRNLARWSLGLWLRNNWGLWEMSPWKWRWCIKMSSTDRSRLQAT